MSFIKPLDAVTGLLRFFRQSSPRAFAVAPGCLFQSCGGGRRREQGGDEGLAVTLAKAQNVMRAHGVDRSLLGACDHKIGERPALQFGRAQEKVLALWLTRASNRSDRRCFFLTVSAFLPSMGTSTHPIGLT